MEAKLSETTELVGKLRKDTGVTGYRLYDHGAEEIMKKMQQEGGCRDAIDNAYREVMRRKKEREAVREQKEAAEGERRGQRIDTKQSSQTP